LFESKEENGRGEGFARNDGVREGIKKKICIGSFEGFYRALAKSPYHFSIFIMFLNQKIYQQLGISSPLLPFKNIIYR
jgi:hypothetical protein